MTDIHIFMTDNLLKMNIKRRNSEINRKALNRFNVLCDEIKRMHIFTEDNGRTRYKKVDVANF